MKNKNVNRTAKAKTAKTPRLKMINSDQKITPFLWFDDQAEQAANFYTSIFEDSAIVDVTRYGNAGPGEKGSVMTVSFELEGQRFVGLNGGPNYKFTPAISFYISCKTQKEVDYFWKRLLTGGGEPSACGWLTDKFGVSWQVIPNALIEHLQDEDPVKAQRVMKAMMEMVKIDVKKIQKAYDEE